MGFFKTLENGWSLARIMAALSQPARPDTLPQRIQLCEQALQLVSREANPPLWGFLQYELGTKLFEDHQGERAANLERARRAFEAALTVCSRETSPVEWASTMTNLAIVYRNRQHGERADNLEEAIRCYQAALTVFTPDAFPQAWAQAQNNLSVAYSHRIKGDRTENLEQAVAACAAALTVFTPQHFAQSWADTQFNLGLILSERIQGEPEAHQEQAIRAFEAALIVYTAETTPESWAETQLQLGQAYYERMRGTHAENLEQARQALEAALTVYTRTHLPDKWAEACHTLGIVYAQRQSGVRAENLEHALACYRHALFVYDRTTTPAEWARVQTNLSSAFLERLLGQRTENLEAAIAAGEAALEIRTRASAPAQWALTQNNLAAAYSQRIRGNRAENIERALNAYEQTLTVYTHDTHPQYWANAHYNLGIAYTERILGDRSLNLEQGLQHLQAALTVYTREAYPDDWADMQHSLSAVYVKRIRGDRAENLEQAIHGCEAALEVYTATAFPEKWANVQYNLGFASLLRMRGEPAANLERALQACTAALEVYTRQRYPVRWAMTSHALGIAYTSRVQGVPEHNLQQAIQIFEDVLTFYTYETFPEEWARTHHNLGNVYARYPQERAEAMLPLAIEHWEKTLEVYTPAHFPQGCRDTAYSLGRSLYKLGRFAEARNAFELAHAAIQHMRGELQREGAKRQLSADNTDLYAHLVACCLKAQDIDMAFTFASAAKGRTFIDMLASVRFNVSTAAARDPELAQRLQQARAVRQQIDTLLANIESDTPAGPMMNLHGLPKTTQTLRQTLMSELRGLQAEEQALWEELSYTYPLLTATQQAPVLTVPAAQQLAQTLEATLVEYYQHCEGWCAFVITADSLHYVPLPQLTTKTLNKMINWVNLVEKPMFHTNVLMGKTLYEWHDAVFAPLRPYIPHDTAVVLAPAWVLNLLPLAAARHPLTDRYVVDDYLLSFTPSLSALAVIQRQHPPLGTDPRSLEQFLNVAYAGTAQSSSYLPELVETTQRLTHWLEEVTPLYAAAATPDAVITHAPAYDAIHFTCHGWFDIDMPDQSGLALAEGWLTVQRIITELRLERAWLVTLAACLGARTDAHQSGEVMGITHALMTAGAQTIVAALWSVEVQATLALFEAFYQRIQSGEAPAVALRAAMAAIRATPGWEHPFYWAAWQVYGLAI